MVSNRPTGKFNLGRSIAQLHRRSQAWFARELEPLNLGASAWPPLLALYCKDGRSQEELADNAGVDKAAMKRAIDALVAAGYAVREEDPEDGRAWRVRLTPLALERRPAVEAARSGWERRLTAGLSRDEVETLRSLLEAMVANVSPGYEGAPSGN